MSDLTASYDKADPIIKYLITGEAIEMHLTGDKQDDFFDQRFGSSVLENDPKEMPRSATVKLIGKNKIEKTDVTDLYNHVLDGNGILILEEGKDTRNIDLLLKKIPAVPQNKYEELSGELVQLMNSWSNKVPEQKSKSML